MSRRRRLLVVAAVVALFGGAWWLGGGGSSDCADDLLAGCPADAQGPAPDPGGREGSGQPVPAPGKGFGFSLGVLAAGDPDPSRGITALRRVGATHYRFNIHWNNTTGPTSPQKPVPDDLRSPLGQARTPKLRSYDAVYTALVAARITPIIILFDAPRWASTLKSCADGFYAVSHPRECPPGWNGGNHLPHRDAYPQYRAWAAAVAERYPKAVLEGHNEPDLQWDGRNQSPGSYPQAVAPEQAAEIQCELRRAIPAPRKLLSMSMSSATYAGPFVAKAKGCYDAFSFHPYPGGEDLGAGSVFARRWAGLREARRAAGDETPIWVTETGRAFTPSPGRPTPGPEDEQALADMSWRLYDRIAGMPDVDVVLFHTLRDAPTEHLADPRDPEHWFGFFDTQWRPHLRACRFLQPGTPALGPCPAVPERAAATTRKKAKPRCRKVTKRMRRNGRLVSRKVFVCPKKATKKKAAPKRRS